MGTGSITGVDDSISIRKKLKIIGYPEQIFQKTAIIKGMFNTDAECSKFEGAKIQTVSGIRGIIKKHAKSDHSGSVRATFEDKISSNDMIFLKTWISVPQNKENLIVPNLIMSDNEFNQWKGLATDPKYHREKKIENHLNNQALVYKEPEKRVEPKPKVLHIPQKIKSALPFKLIKENVKKFEANKSSTDIEAILDTVPEHVREHRSNLSILDEIKKERRFKKQQKTNKANKLTDKAKQKNNRSTENIKIVNRKVRNILRSNMPK
ncbi:MAG: Glycoside hydrolase 2 (Mannanase, beta-galactosidase) [Paramarteilia canceri]